MNFTELYEDMSGKIVAVVSGDYSGTGFFIDRRGYIATAEHVVSGKENVEVITVFSNPNSIPARVVKRNQKLDIAILKIEHNEDLPTVELGDSSQVKIGDEIVILGFPFGKSMWGIFLPAIHRGIISNTIQLVENQAEEKITKRFQLDVMANKGNSGGPLALNKNGKAIGVLTNVILEKTIGDAILIGGKSITSPTGIAMATPSDYLREMMTSLEFSSN